MKSPKMIGIILLYFREYVFFIKDSIEFTILSLDGNSIIPSEFSGHFPLSRSSNYSEKAFNVGLCVKNTLMIFQHYVVSE